MSDEKFTAEDFESLQTKLKDEQTKSDSLQNTQSELEEIFLNGLDDDVKALIPEGLSLTEKIKLTTKLNKKFDELSKSLGKQKDNDGINNPGNQQPGGNHGNLKEFEGLTGSDLIFATLNYKNYK